MLSILINSKSRVKLLTFFLTHPEEKFYYTELFKRLQIPHSALQKELKRLHDAGLLKTSKEANLRYYWVNKNFSIYPELKNIILKTVGISDVLKNKLTEIGNIQMAFIYGSVAKNIEDAKSDIDLMIIGNPNLDILNEITSEAEKTLQRVINYTVFAPKEWGERIKKKESFVNDVLKNKKIFLIGAEDELRRLA